MFFFNATTTTEIYTLSLHDALPIFRIVEIDGHHRLAPYRLAKIKLARKHRLLGNVFQGNLTSGQGLVAGGVWRKADRKSTRLNSSHSQISYAVFCLKKKKKRVKSTK